MYGWQRWHGRDRQLASPRGGGNSDEEEFSLRQGTASRAFGSPFHGNRQGGRAAFAPSHHRCSSESRRTRGPSCPTCLGFLHHCPQMHLFALLSSGEPVDTTDWLRNLSCNRRALTSIKPFTLQSQPRMNDDTRGDWLMPFQTAAYSVSTGGGRPQPSTFQVKSICWTIQIGTDFL